MKVTSYVVGLQLLSECSITGIVVSLHSSVVNHAVAMIVPDVVEFAELKGNSALSTKAGKLIAKGNFNKFLICSNKPTYEDLEENDLCNPSLLKQYATFLVSHYVTKDDKPLMCDSAKQYVSGVFMAIQERYPENRFYNSNVQNHEWYAKLRNDIEDEVTLRCIEVGEEVASKSFPVGRDTLRGICCHLLRENK